MADDVVGGVALEGDPVARVVDLRVVGVAVDTLQLAAPPIVVIGTVSGCPRRRRVLADALDDDERIGPAPRRRVPEERIARARTLLEQVGLRAEFGPVQYRRLRIKEGS